MGTRIEWTCPDCGMAQPISLRQVALACPACGFRLEESEGLQFVRKAIVDALWPMADRSCPKGEISQRIQTRLGELGLWKKLPGDYAELSVCDLIVVFLLMQEKGWLEELAEMPIESVKPYMWRALEIKAEPILSICEAFVNGEEAAINRVGKAIQDNPNAVVPVESFFAFRDWSCDEETQDEILACLAKGVRNLGKSAASTVKKFSPQTRRMLWRVNRKLPGLKLEDVIDSISLGELLRVMKEDKLPASCLKKFPFDRLTREDWVRFLSAWSRDLPDKVIEQMTPVLSSFSKDEIGLVTRVNKALARFFPAASLPPDVFVDYFQMPHADTYFSAADFNALPAAQWKRLCRESALDSLRKLPFGELTTERLLTLLRVGPLAMVATIPDACYARMSAQDLCAFLLGGRILGVPAAMDCMARVAVPRLTKEMKDTLVSCYRDYLAIIPVQDLSEDLFVSLYLEGRASERSYFTKEAFEKIHLLPAAWTRLLEGCGGIRVPPLAEEFLAACTSEKRREIFSKNHHLLFALKRFLTGRELNAFGLAAWGKICQAASREELKRLPFAELDFAHFHHLLLVCPDVIADIPEACYARFDPAETTKLLQETKLVETASLHGMIETVMLPRLTREDQQKFLRGVLKSSHTTIPAFVEKEFACCDPAFRMELFKDNPSLATRLDRSVLSCLTNEEFLLLCDQLAGAQFLFEARSPKSLAHGDQVKLLTKYPLRAEFFDWKGWSLPDVCVVTRGGADNIALRREYPQRMKLWFYRHRKAVLGWATAVVVIGGFFTLMPVLEARENRLKVEAEAETAEKIAKAKATAEYQKVVKAANDAEKQKRDAEKAANDAEKQKRDAEKAANDAEKRKRDAVKDAENAKTAAWLEEQKLQKAKRDANKVKEAADKEEDRYRNKKAAADEEEKRYRKMKADADKEEARLQDMENRLKVLESEDALAQYRLGNRYYDGDGVEQDYESAVECYRKAAEKGHPGAQRNLGRMYSAGQGVAQNYATAVKWYRRAAEQGDAMAQYNLGVMYEAGRGVEKDPKKALEWFQRAAKAGNKEALEYLRKSKTQSPREKSWWGVS